jgi:hypothetical protein
MRAILDDDPTRLVLVLSMLWGVSNALDTAMVKNHGDLFTVQLILALAVIIGPSGGLMVLSIMSYYFTGVGRLLGGRGTARELRAAFAWSSVPQVVGLILLVPLLVVIGSDLFSSDVQNSAADLPQLLLLLTVGLVLVILQLWSIILYIKLIAEAHRFSSWRALLTMLSWPLLFAILILAFYLGGR